MPARILAAETSSVRRAVTINPRITRIPRINVDPVLGERIQRRPARAKRAVAGHEDRNHKPDTLQQACDSGLRVLRRRLRRRAPLTSVNPCNPRNPWIDRESGRSRISCPYHALIHPVES